MTNTEIIVKALLSTGFSEIPSKTSKARTFQKEDRLYFVGKRGSLRKGKCYSKSYSVTYSIDNFKKIIEKHSK